MSATIVVPARMRLRDAVEEERAACNVYKLLGSAEDLARYRRARAAVDTIIEELQK